MARKTRQETLRDGRKMVAENMPRVYRQLGLDIEDVDSGAAELGLLRTIIQAHIGRVKSGTIDGEAFAQLCQIYLDLHGVINPELTPIFVKAVEILLDEKEKEDHGSQQNSR